MYSWLLKRVSLKGPVPIGFGSVHLVGSVTLLQMCFGSIMTLLKLLMNVESGLIRLTWTPYFPTALMDLMLVVVEAKLIRSNAALIVLPASRLYTASAEVNGTPSENVTLLRSV